MVPPVFGAVDEPPPEAPDELVAFPPPHAASVSAIAEPTANRRSNRALDLTIFHPPTSGPGKCPGAKVMRDYTDFPTKFGRATSVGPSHRCVLRNRSVDCLRIQRVPERVAEQV